jgi:hypothetical protein
VVEAAEPDQARVADLAMQLEESGQRLVASGQLV